MKITILLTLAVTAIVTTSNAQETTVAYATQAPVDSRGSFYIGPKVGINYANVYDSEGENFDADGKIGFAAGVFLTIPIGRFIGIQPEVLYSQKGFRATGTLLGSPYELKRTTNFIDVPILFALKPSPSVTLLAGPQFSYLMKQTDEFTGSPANTVQEEEFKNDNIRKNILCFLGGMDFNFDQVVLGTRVGWDIQNNNGDGTSTTPRYKNVWFQATLGIRL